MSFIIFIDKNIVWIFSVVELLERMRKFDNEKRQFFDKKERKKMRKSKRERRKRGGMRQLDKEQKTLLAEFKDRDKKRKRDSKDAELFEMEL